MKNKMVKILALVSAAVLSVGTLTACGSQAQKRQLLMRHSQQGQRSLVVTFPYREVLPWRNLQMHWQKLHDEISVSAVTPEFTGSSAMKQ